MSELQIGLLAIGVVVVAGVLVYNRIQERRAGRESGQAFHSRHDDVLLSGGESSQPAAAARTPAQHHAPRASTAGAAAPDSLIDYIVQTSGPLPGLQENWPAIARRHGGRVLAGEAPGGGVRAGLQLVSRAGAVGEADLIEFRSALETLAADAGATVSAPEMRAAMQAARDLDEFCAESDLQVVLHLVAPQGGQFPGAGIREGVEAAGLSLEADGRFAMRDHEQRLLFTLAARDGAPFAAASMPAASAQALSLTLDLPRTPDAPRVFEAMARLAHQLTSTLGGDIVDDNGNRLDDRALNAIAQQLRPVCERLEAHGLAPGSPLALRLFS